jgi:hypothetical protein
MEAEFARGIVEAAEADGIDLTLYDGYSGRGMFGNKTTGVQGSWKDFTNAVVGYVMMLQGEENGDFRIDELRDIVRNIDTDQMGRSDLIFY